MLMPVAFARLEGPLTCPLVLPDAVLVLAMPLRALGSFVLLVLCNFLCHLLIDSIRRFF